MSEFIEYTDPEWRGLDMRSLKVDEAYVILRNFYNKITYLYAVSDECYTCCYSKVKAVHPNVDFSDQQVEAIKKNAVNIKVNHAIKFKIFDEDVGEYAFDNQTSLCKMYRTEMEEFGVYNLTIDDSGKCTFDTDKEGVNVNLSFLSVFLLVSLILIAMKIASCAWRYYRYEEESTEPTEVPTLNAAERAKQRTRMRSIDALRGLAIVLMIFVNSGGGDYWWMDHAPWNGIYVADLVFPIFLWIMGVCIPISVKVQIARGMPKGRIIMGIIKRSIKLFVIGLFLNSVNGPQLEQLRIMGVLQRLGIVYLVCGIVHTIFTKAEQIPPQVQWKRSIHELLILKGEFSVMLVIVAIHLGLLFGLHVPNCPSGYLGPGGNSENRAHPHCIGGPTGYIDLQILGNGHMYQHPTAKHIYDSTAFDPEGILGCLLSVVHGFIGCLAGVIILVHSNWTERILRWIFWAFALALLAGILCLFSIEHGYIPINKNLWSLPFVFITSALGFVMLSALYYIIDERMWWTGFPFVESGKNSIIMFVGHTIMHKMLPWHWRIGAMNTHFVLLLESTWNTLLWVAIALYLNSIKFYYSV